MARPLRIEYPNAFYHVTSRGNEKKEIFKSSADREKFLEYLESAVTRYGAVIHTYCLMSNHYHILLETPLGNLSQIMRHINGAYTTYYNIKRKRAGHLLQGRYKAILVQADEYAKELSRYIHLNPVRAGITARPEEYPWSSYKTYIGKAEKPECLKTDFIHQFFDKDKKEAKKQYRQFTNDLIGKEYDSPLKRTVASTILGSENFIKEVTEKHLGEKKNYRNLPELKELSSKPSIEEIIEKVKKVIGEDEEMSKAASIYLCRKYSGARLKEIGIYFGIGESGVSQASRRFAVKISKGDKSKKRIETIEGELNMSRV